MTKTIKYKRSGACKNCNGVFTRKLKSGGVWTKFCSPECHNEWRVGRPHPHKGVAGTTGYMEVPAHTKKKVASTTTVTGSGHTMFIVGSDLQKALDDFAAEAKATKVEASFRQLCREVNQLWFFVKGIAALGVLIGVYLMY